MVESTFAEVSFIEVGRKLSCCHGDYRVMWTESGGMVLKEEDREVMEKGRIGALLSSVDAGHKLGV